MAKIFLTGATGYVGGEVLHRLAASSRPKHAITSLIRDAAKADIVKKAFPDVDTLEGDLDDTKLIEEESRKADIVLHLAATGHIASSTAISNGLANPERKQPGHWIQISGATLLAAKEIAEGRFGEHSDTSYDDVKDIDDIISIIKKNPKRAVDNLVISQNTSKVKTALIVGPHIYGTGRGPVNTRSIQAPEIAKATLKLQSGFRLGEGKNAWSNVHVHDLSSLIVSLVDAAVEKESGLWYNDGIYLPENGSLTFGDLSAKTATEAKMQKLIPQSAGEKVIQAAEADALSGHASILWGTNAVIKSSRARSLLKWQPSSPSLEDEIPAIVSREGRGYQSKL